MQGRLLFRNEDEVARARRWGIDDLDRVYSCEEMAKGDCIFAATGVTDGSLLEGVHRRKACVTTKASSCAQAPARSAAYRLNITTSRTAASRPPLPYG